MKRGVPTDSVASLGQMQSLTITPAQVRAAGIAVCARSTDVDDAADLCAALGITPATIEHGMGAVANMAGALPGEDGAA